MLFSEHSFVPLSDPDQAVGGTPVVAPAKNWGNDLEALKARISERTRVIFIANPNNPTGTWLGGGELEAFVRAVPPEVLVVVDEAYFDYAIDPATGPRITPIPSTGCCAIPT